MADQDLLNQINSIYASALSPPPQATPVPAPEQTRYTPTRLILTTSCLALLIYGLYLLGSNIFDLSSALLSYVLSSPRPSVPVLGPDATDTDRLAAERVAALTDEINAGRDKGGHYWDAWVDSPVTPPPPSPLGPGFVERQWLRASSTVIAGFETVAGDARYVLHWRWNDPLVRLQDSTQWTRDLRFLALVAFLVCLGLGIRDSRAASRAKAMEALDEAQLRGGNWHAWEKRTVIPKRTWTRLTDVEVETVAGVPIEVVTGTEVVRSTCTVTRTTGRTRTETLTSKTEVVTVQETVDETVDGIVEKERVKKLKEKKVKIKKVDERKNVRHWDHMQKRDGMAFCPGCGQVHCCEFPV